MNIKAALLGLLVLIFVVNAAAQEQSPTVPQQPAAPTMANRAADDAPSKDELTELPDEVANQPAFQSRTPRYLIRPGDSFEISFAFAPEFNQTVAVQPDGFVTLKEVGDLYVQAKTLPQLREELGKAYSAILKEPVVTVVLKEFEKPYFTAGGEVERPGRYDMRSNLTVTEAVMMAGGFTQNAKHSEVLLFRRVSDQWVNVRKVNVKKLLASGNLSEDRFLRPGDMLFIPKNRISKIRQWLPTTNLGLRPEFPQ